MTRLRSERGYTLVEMLTVLVIMGVVMGGLTTWKWGGWRRRT